MWGRSIAARWYRRLLPLGVLGGLWVALTGAPSSTAGRIFSFVSVTFGLPAVLITALVWLVAEHHLEYAEWDRKENVLQREKRYMTYSFSYVLSKVESGIRKRPWLRVLVSLLGIPPVSEGETPSAVTVPDGGDGREPFESRLERFDWLQRLAAFLLGAPLLWLAGVLMEVVPEPPGHPFVYALPLAVGAFLGWLSVHLAVRHATRHLGEHVQGLERVDADQDVYVAVCDCGWRSQPSGPVDALRQGREHTLSMERPP